MYIATYIPPPGSPFYDLSQTACHITEFDTCINELLEQDGDLHIICNGDFNARSANYRLTQNLAKWMETMMNRFAMYHCLNPRNIPGYRI